ncbi:17060_t:CDS:2 [Dentiscutata erythropus]|uniref:17060_t:CDS:1 n=1 Tax=Dentiscutata erythropus TaxID=1348616 RepID=A0A9N9I5P4_9GLOM|nr:17060_t:CDS:2 [Dentiscutata erythropus]
MESFFVEFEPISAITIFTALCKRVETDEWTDNEDLEVQNFIETLDRSLVHVKNAERLNKLLDFRDDNLLKQRISDAVGYIRSSLELDILDVEPLWIVDAKKNFEILKNEVHKLALLESNSDKEKDMWQAVEMELNKINVEKLGYDHPLCSGILDDSLEPFTTISKDFLKTFKKPCKKFELPESTELKNICVEFVQKENEKYLNPPQNFGNAVFGEFLDKPEKLQELTNQMLRVLSQVYSSPKWKATKPSNINEGSGEKASSASAVRKGSCQRARRPDYMVITKVNSKEVEIGYLETGRPKSSSDKQIQDHKKLNRFCKDSIDTIKSQRNKRVYGDLELDYLSIFTINIAGDVVEFRSMCKEFGLYRVWLLNKVKIPLNILSAKPKDVYSLIHNLLAFRTAIACTISKMLYGPDDTMEVISTISTSSAMSVDSSISTVGSPSHYSSSQKNTKKRRTKKNKNQYIFVAGETSK